VHDSKAERDVGTSEQAGFTLAVPALGEMEKQVADRPRKTEAIRQHLGHLAQRGHVRSMHAHGAGQANGGARDPRG
jgi:hypothetical protein